MNMLRTHWIGWTIGLTLFIEIVTCVLRFGFKLRSAHDTSFIAPFTFGIRIHHGYVGLLLILISWLLTQKEATGHWILLIAGLSLFLSDMIHHFLVLWAITGSPDFDLVYGARK